MAEGKLSALCWAFTLTSSSVYDAATVSSLDRTTLYFGLPTYMEYGGGSEGFSGILGQIGTTVAGNLIDDLTHRTWRLGHESFIPC